MITTKRLIVGLAMVSFAASLSLPAYAQTSSGSALSGVVTAGDQSIATRIADLNTLNTKVAAMQTVSAGEKTNFSLEVQAQINALNAVRAKIDTGTDLSNTRINAQSVLTTFPIYTLIIPQGYLLVSADRINAIGTLVTHVSSKLQGRVADATVVRGTNVSGDAKLFADIAAKVADADAHATLATNGIIFLLPDNGNGTTATNNKTALLAARANIAISVQDLEAARKDIKEITQSLDIVANTPDSAEALQ